MSASLSRIFNVEYRTSNFRFGTFFSSAFVRSETGQESELWLITGYLTPRFYEGSFEYERSLTMAQGVKP